MAERGWPFYARPRLAHDAEPTADEIRQVLARQSELKVPLELEWVHETAPTMVEAARSAGMTVHECPLLVLGHLVQPRPAAGEVRLMDADDAELANAKAAINVAFGAPGTAVSEAGVAERDAAATSSGATASLGFTIDALRDGRTVMAGALVRDVGAVGGGSHNPRGEVTEMVGVGILPAFRRRRLAGALAHLLAQHARDNGVTTVFCGAESNDVARIYEGVGFRRIGTTCMAGIN